MIQFIFNNKFKVYTVYTTCKMLTSKKAGHGPAVAHESSFIKTNNDNSNKKKTF